MKKKPKKDKKTAGVNLQFTVSKAVAVQIDHYLKDHPVIGSRAHLCRYALTEFFTKSTPAGA